MELAENEQERQQWEASIAELCDACLVDWDDTGSALVMLQPVKEGFFLLAEADEVESCILQWCSYYAPILEQANNRHVPNRQDAHTYVVEHLPQLFHLLKRMLAPEWQEQLYPAIALFTQKLHNYFQFSTLQGLDILKKLLPFAQQQGNHSLEGLISKKQADLLRRTGQLPQALDLYAQAESLFRQEHNNLGLANTLFSRADLLRRTGQLPQALDLYAQAESLFRQQQDNLGLANTLFSRADLLSRTGQLQQALDLYAQAQILYRQEQDDLGLANTLFSRAVLLRLTGKFPKALDLYAQAESLYRQEQDNLGLANTLRNRADLLSLTGQLQQALDLYAQAESLYRQEQVNLGLANTLQSRADLLNHTGQLPQALDLYAQAESLYRQEHNNLGLANSLLSQALVHLSSHNYEYALDFLFQALPLYESEQEPWGIASTCAWLSKLCLLFEKQAHQAPALEQRAREIAETLPPNQKEIILSILNNKNP